jgi:hypothetical protein
MKLVATVLGVVALSPPPIYPVVAHLGFVPVRAPARTQAWGVCPSHALRLDHKDLVQAERATLLALRTVAQRARPPLRIRGARVIGLRGTRRPGDIMPTLHSCWGTPFRRSALVRIVLPAEQTSPDIRGNPWFYVARTTTAWVVWDEVH